MPTLKNFTSNLLNRTKSSSSVNTSPDDNNPESTAARAVRLFCESGSPENQGEEVLHLPVIVEAAESSPPAAAASAHQIRKFLSKDHFSKPHVQYNSIMLMRILAENPGPSFTKNIDTKFVNTVANLLRTGRDPSVQQILRETLDAFEAERYNDPGLKKLLEMWRTNKGFRAAIVPRAPQQQGNNNQQWAWQPGMQGAPMPQRSKLPPQAELASRVEESKNTAKILMQLVQSTPTDEVMGNELIKEFADRCQAAQRSMQGFINCDNPPPDDDTLQTLIEVNEQLSLSLSRHQRAVLSARRTLGINASNTNSPQPEQQSQAGQPVYVSPPLGPRQGGQPNYLGGSGSPPLPQQSMQPLTPEPPAQSQFIPPPGPPPKKGSDEKDANPFADDAAERSNFGQRSVGQGGPNAAEPFSGGAEQTRTVSPPPPQPQPTSQPIYRY